MLSDHHVDGQQRWSKVKEKMETDPRYKAVETSAAREEFFKSFVEKLTKVEETSSLSIVYQIGRTLTKRHRLIKLFYRP